MPLHFVFEAIQIADVCNLWFRNRRSAIEPQRSGSNGGIASLPCRAIHKTASLLRCCEPFNDPRVECIIAILLASRNPVFKARVDVEVIGLVTIPIKGLESSTAVVNGSARLRKCYAPNSCMTRKPWFLFNVHDDTQFLRFFLPANVVLRF